MPSYLICQYMFSASPRHLSGSREYRTGTAGEGVFISIFGPISREVGDIDAPPLRLNYELKNRAPPASISSRVISQLG